MNHIFTRIALLVITAMLPCMVWSQCLQYPVPFSDRVNGASTILFGKVTDQHCYADERGNIYTNNTVAVTAWLKNNHLSAVVHVITLGGVFNGSAQITYPAVQLQKGREYLLMLEADNHTADDKVQRTADPAALQTLPYSDAQGAWLYNEGKYQDLFVEGALTEETVMSKIRALTGQQALRPDGSNYQARQYVAARGTNTMAVTSFSPNPTNAGTVNPADYLTINGSGFGNTVGTVQFANADDGGSSYVSPPNTSDYVSWTDNQIVVKVPTGNSTNAGTGNFIVNGTMVSPQILTIGYSHISINSDFSGFATPTRQRYYLRNLDGIGGYTFTYNSNFASNTSAVNAFERALNTWKCNTGINWRAAGTTSAVYTDDNINTVLFDATLTAGVLARATSRFNGSAIPGTCDLDNTIWWLKEVDVQVQPSVNWQFGPANAVPGQYDFETVVLHELGHAHGLGHRIAPGQLMNYALGSGVNIRTPAAVEVQGGQAKMAYSTIPTCFNPSGSGTPMIAASCPLPVRLLTFTAQLQQDGALLQWQTSNEMNTAEFEVQKSMDGADFRMIGNVKPKGAVLNDYTFTDPKLQNGVTYYRLKIKDTDATFQFSNIASVKVNGLAASWSVYMNPVRSVLQIASGVKTQVQLLDATGKMLRSVVIAPGMNTVDVSNLASGTYYLFAPNSGERKRILVIH